MLVLSRKVGEVIVIPAIDVAVTVQSVRGRRVRLAVSAPPKIPVHREEVHSRDESQLQTRIDELPVEGVSVLIADADASLAVHYETHLSRLGYEVAIASDGLSCVSCLRRRSPHLVVLDAGLLWGRTEGVLAMIEEHVDVPSVPVLVSYDEAHRHTLSALRHFEFCDFVAKPLTPQQLAAYIRQLIPFQVADYGSQRQVFPWR